MDGMRSPTEERRLSRIDGLILFTATASGLALPAILNRNGPAKFLAAGLRRAIHQVAFWFAVEDQLDYLAICWAAALVVLRLRRPRPDSRRLFRRPGFVACITATFAYGWMLVIEAPALLRTFFFPSGARLAPLRFFITLPLRHTYLAPAVAVTWTILILARSWRPEPSWIDRAGRALGIYWLVVDQIIPWIAEFIP